MGLHFHDIVTYCNRLDPTKIINHMEDFCIANCCLKVNLTAKSGHMYSARNKDQNLVSHFLKIGYFIGY